MLMTLQKNFSRQTQSFALSLPSFLHLFFQNISSKNIWLIDYIKNFCTILLSKERLIVMSIETKKNLASRFELYSLIKEGLDNIAQGNAKPLSNSMSDIKSRHKQ